MKKNNVMRIASALLVAVLLTTCAISGTFAKYTTSSTGNASARVAKWGFDAPATINFDNLFLAEYKNGAVSSDEDVVAPGTSGSVTITLVANGDVTETEVAYRFDATIAKSNETDDALLAKLVWKLNDQIVGTEGTFDDLVAAINELDGNYYPGEEGPDATTLKISWEWPFYENETADTEDTNLGRTDAKVGITFTFSATQIETVTTEAETTEAAGE